MKKVLAISTLMVMVIFGVAFAQTPSTVSPVTLREMLINGLMAIAAVVIPLIVNSILEYVSAKAKELKARAKESENAMVNNRGSEVADIVIRAAEAALHVKPNASIEEYLKTVGDSAMKEISDSTTELYKNLNKDLAEVVKNLAVQAREKFFRRNTPVTA